ncbi:hypothetical protein EMIHUDRAFT_214634 [Emiliania huxleyi CCMP1516]|uniref:N-acetyltransferase domain-containing protein n=2 Tax=Emiliania huxleyi TaxID=2903 RepID=A0A0D3IJ87_EMIH1|nr:hypothetical protein EMIHUDRAFT_214634 [Emiliania huxleyi CCMP1516]EOD11322.1 hypothetical protein EMIHUDRAFT_214634 [Emiliania huxleyi CCMP1516]|eukprot:XP_005763751.1 hypothetical protein EMIHUDRAFT_214634 [Emiliania huxleyi CCMP1516]
MRPVLTQLSGAELSGETLWGKGAGGGAGGFAARARKKGARTAPVRWRGKEALPRGEGATRESFANLLADLRRLSARVAASAATSAALQQALDEKVATLSAQLSALRARATHAESAAAELQGELQGVQQAGEAGSQEATQWDDYLLSRDTPILRSLAQCHAHLAAGAGLQLRCIHSEAARQAGKWSRTAPRPYELAVRNEAEEIFVAFKLQLAAPVRPWHSPHTRRLVVTHVGVPEPFRRRGVLSRTMDALAEAVLPDEIEVDRVLSDTMRAYCCSRGYDLVPAQPGDALTVCLLSSCFLLRNLLGTLLL